MNNNFPSVGGALSGAINGISMGPECIIGGAIIGSVSILAKDTLGGTHSNDGTSIALPVPDAGSISI
ncbi:hypothetical protein [Burkholderia cepacia]|uniref:hypothetical protein n=1 Tax=Burkholderia cepacia TaxID=292 RepID=UPI000AA0A458|nr:hypothetical protein [Burkholderia cepacia]